MDSRSRFDLAEDAKMESNLCIKRHVWSDL
jgi:hypothetical protein